jgi:hypothetical protein
MSDEYKILVCKFGNVLLDEDIFFRVRGTQKPRPYHKLKEISNIQLMSTGKVICCRFAKKRKFVSLSRLIMNAGGKDIIDHISRNPLDNQRSNLRKVNIRQNSLNRTCGSNTGFFGVSLNKRRRCIGCFNTGKKILTFNVKDSETNRILCAFAHDKFVLQSGDEEYAPLNFPCFKYEPFKSILLKENLYEHKEK